MPVQTVFVNDLPLTTGLAKVFHAVIRQGNPSALNARRLANSELAEIVKADDVILLQWENAKHETKSTILSGKVVLESLRNVAKVAKEMSVTESTEKKLKHSGKISFKVDKDDSGWTKVKAFNVVPPVAAESTDK